MRADRALQKQRDHTRKLERQARNFQKQADGIRDQRNGRINRAIDRLFLSGAIDLCDVAFLQRECRR